MKWLMLFWHIFILSYSFIGDYAWKYKYMYIFTFWSENDPYISVGIDGLWNQCHTSVRTNHSSGRPRRVKTAQGRVKLTHQSSDRTSVKKTHNQLTFHETTATNSHSIRTLNSTQEVVILSLLVRMLSCAWWERSVNFCLVPCSEWVE